ncbi:MAG: protein kinase [Myxococcales bacterium]|nr:protein kinase [Myxococcales bacterium]
MQLEPGRVIDGRYELERRIGVGGMGEVWRAKHLRLPQHVAVKVLKHAGQQPPESLLRFRREAEVASKLAHPHIIRALDWGELDDGVPYLVLELLTGMSLREALDGRPMPVARAVDVARQVASGLSAAHREGIVHRDLKPENVYLCDDGTGEWHIKLLDFGISKMHTAATALTREHAVFGTPHYMAPEQADGHSGDVDARADQYALAVITYEMLTGGPPFRDETRPLQLLYKVVHEAPPALGSLRPDLPAALVQVVERAMAKEPGARYETVNDFANDLARAMGMSVYATPRVLGPSVREMAAMATLAGDSPQPTLPPRVGQTGPPPRTDDVGTAETVAQQASAPQTPAAPTAQPTAGPARRGRLPALLAIVTAAALAVAGVMVVRGMRGGSGSQASQDGRAEVASDTGRETKTKTETKAKTESETKTKTKTKSETDTPTKTKSELGAKTKSKLGAKTQAKTKAPSKARVGALSAELRAKLAEARALIGRSELDAWDRARQLARVLPSGHRWRAFEVQALAMCKHRDLAGVQDALGHVPAAARRRVKTRCAAKYSFDVP